MKLVDLSLTEFAQVLGSDAPAPGGGSAAALSAANGISLTKMVCELTLGKKKYAEFEAEIAQVHAESDRLQERLLAAIDKDTEAFNLVSAVFDMPKETEEDKAARREAMQQALKEATKSPYGMMEDILAALQTTQKAVGKSIPMLPATWESQLSTLRLVCKGLGSMSSSTYQVSRTKHSSQITAARVKSSYKKAAL